MSKLPLLNQEPLYHVDGTPNNDYVLRILRVYRHNAGCNWVADPPSPLLDEMNRVNALRAKLLWERKTMSLSKEDFQRLLGSIEHYRDCLTYHSFLEKAAEKWGSFENLIQEKWMQDCVKFEIVSFTAKMNYIAKLLGFDNDKEKFSYDDIVRKIEDIAEEAKDNL